MKYDNNIKRIDENSQSAPHNEAISPSEIKLKKLNDLGLISIICSNYEVFYFWKKRGRSQMIAPSLYERFLFVNKGKVSLIDYAEFLGSIKCFRILLLKESNLKKLGK